jgi:hypothetical protein
VTPCSASTLMILDDRVLAGLSAGAVAYAFMFNSIANETQASTDRSHGRQAERRRTSRWSRPRATGSPKSPNGASRSRTLSGSRREAEGEGPQHAETAPEAPDQAGGHDGPLERFYLFSALSGLAFAVLALIGGAPLWAVPAAALAGGVGLPRWVIAFVKARRIKAFLEELPNALDIIVPRGQVGPSDQRRHPSDRQRITRAGPRRIPPHGRGAADRHVDAGGGTAHGRDHALPGSGILRHRHPDPGAGRRQSVRGPGATSRACSAIASG